MLYDAIVIGAGTAGMTAALNIARAGKTAIMLECSGYGGQIAFSPKVENFPSIRQISGAQYSDALLDQVLSLGVDTEFERAVQIVPDGKYKKVLTEEGNEYGGKTVIIASGASHRNLDLENEERLCGNGISYCAVCDGAFFKNGVVAVVGGGDTAVQDAVYLSSLCSKIYLIHRRDTFRAESHNVAALERCGNVEKVLSSEIVSIEGIASLSSVTVQNKNDNTRTKLSVDGLFIAVGQIPNTESFKDVVSLDPNGFVVAGEDCKTSADGIFVAGDCRTKALRQLTTAAADGAVAAIAACSYIDSL